MTPSEANVQADVDQAHPADLDCSPDPIWDCRLTIHPRLPEVDGIFGLGHNLLIASHAPHDHVREHLHHQLPHMHIRYGFEIPAQPLHGIAETALQVAMAVSVEHRVDCNPIFVARASGEAGVCLKIAGIDVHWVHDDDVAKKADAAYRATGRVLPTDTRFIGFSTADLGERKKRRYSRSELLATIGRGLRCDQHFQATWIEPREEAIAPYPVTIYLADDASSFETFFVLSPTVRLGAF